MITSCIVALTPQHACAQLVINELMQSNIDCLMDDMNEFPDSWVELYNNSLENIDLANYKLGDSNDPTQAWQLPSQTVQPYSYVLVYCDKEATGLHTDFRLDSGKGAVYLFKGSDIADQVSFKKQPAPNIAYGRAGNASEEWGYMYITTPGKSNIKTLCTKILGEPIFSETGKVITNSKTITLTLSLPEGSPEGTTIRYTTDGTEPTGTSYSYSSPITINKTTTVRAKLFKSGYMSPRSTTHSYIYHGREQTLPVISIVTNNNYFYDNTIGIYVDGTYNSNTKNYEYDWRRPINLEYFEVGKEESQLNQLCETRIQGGASRGNARKSLAIYANKRFGTKRFQYEFFPDQKPGITDFKSLVLRNAGNDFDYLFMRDAIIQRTMASHVDLDWQAWKPAIVYINGEYKGMLNIRERSNEDNIYTNYDGLEDIDMFENWWELKEGDWENYDAFKNFYAEHGHTLAEYEQWIDWKEFINLMIMNLYYNNQDFPGNNIVMWRPKTDGGVWRFIAKDTDFGLGLYNSSPSYNTIAWLHNPDYDADRAWANGWEHTRLFRRMMEDNDFKREFLDRCAVYMGDFMNERGTREVWDPMYEMIKTEYTYHRKLINEWWPNYSSELSSARNWIANRTSSFYQQLSDYYGLGTACPLTVDKDLTDEERANLTLTINDIPVTTGYFDGKFFQGRSITFKGTPVAGKKVSGWNVTVTPTNNNPVSYQINGDTYTLSMPNCNSMKINAIIIDDPDATGIDDVKSKAEWTWKKVGGQIEVSNVPSGISVSLYDIKGILLYHSLSNGGKMSIPAPNNTISILKVGETINKIILN